MRTPARTSRLGRSVIIEMLSAFSALSEDGSPVQMPPWRNAWLARAASDPRVLYLSPVKVVDVPFVQVVLVVEETIEIPQVQIIGEIVEILAIYIVQGPKLQRVWVLLLFAKWRLRKELKWTFSVCRTCASDIREGTRA